MALRGTKLVFIHGAPGSGKLTTAKALLSRVDGRLFDNHAAIDIARSVFDFGAAGFWELVKKGADIGSERGCGKWRSARCNDVCVRRAR